MEMTEEEYKSKLAREKFPQAYQFGKVDENKGIIDEMRQDRTVQKKIMVIAVVSAVAAVLAAIFYFIKNFR